MREIYLGVVKQIAKDNIHLERGKDRLGIQVRPTYDHLSLAVT